MQIFEKKVCLDAIFVRPAIGIREMFAIFA